jgi:hypothetical protein
VVHVPAPDVEGCRAILHVHVRRMPLAEDILRPARPVGGTAFGAGAGADAPGDVADAGAVAERSAAREEKETLEKEKEKDPLWKDPLWPLAQFVHHAAGPR